MQIPKITLNNSNKMPALGLGTWKSDKGKVKEAVKYAIIEAGYRHIDCAASYGNEKEIGEAFSEIFSNSDIKREDVFVTSKLWNTEHNPENVEKACKQTLEDLQLEYLDLYLIHWGIAFEPSDQKEPLDENGVVKKEKVSLQETWKAMEELVDKGLVKSIGISNYTPPMIEDLLSYATIKPAINQIELHPFNAQNEVVKYCKYREVELTAYSPLGNPTLAGDENLLNNEIINQIAKDINRTPAQVLIRWGIQRGTIVIPKSTNPERIKENITALEFELTEEQMKKINSLNKDHRYVNPVSWWGVPYFN